MDTLSSDVVTRQTWALSVFALVFLGCVLNIAEENVSTGWFGFEKAAKRVALYGFVCLSVICFGVYWPYCRLYLYVFIIYGQHIRTSLTCILTYSYCEHCTNVNPKGWTINKVINLRIWFFGVYQSSTYGESIYVILLPYWFGGPPSPIHVCVMCRCSSNKFKSIWL